MTLFNLILEKYYKKTKMPQLIVFILISMFIGWINPTTIEWKYFSMTGVTL